MKQVRHSSRLDQGEGVIEDRTRRYHPSPPGRTGLQGHGGSRQQIAQKTPIIRNGRLSLDGLLLFDLPPEGLYRLLGIVRCGSDSASHLLEPVMNRWFVYNPRARLYGGEQVLPS